LVAAVENHTKLVETARKNLADARADHASAHCASIIGRIDGVESGIRPIGPGRVTITAAGGAAGLIFGVGLVFLFGVPQTAVVSVAKSNGQSAGLQQPFGFTHQMTLDKAVRSAEKGVGSRLR
jgi:hypothetical protein